MDSSSDQFELEQEVEPVVRAGAAHGTDDIMIWVHIGDVIAEGFAADLDRDPDDKHPTLVLRRMTAQQLFDDLWAMGFRPEPEIEVRLSADVTGVVDAINRLQDVNDALVNRMAVSAEPSVALAQDMHPDATTAVSG